MFRPAYKIVKKEGQTMNDFCENRPTDIQNERGRRIHMEDRIKNSEALTEDVSDKLADDLAEDVSGAGERSAAECTDVLAIDLQIKKICQITGKLKR